MDTTFILIINFHNISRFYHIVIVVVIECRRRSDFGQQFSIQRTRGAGVMALVWFVVCLDGMNFMKL